MIASTHWCHMEIVSERWVRRLGCTCGVESTDEAYVRELDNKLEEKEIDADTVLEDQLGVAACVEDPLGVAACVTQPTTRACSALRYAFLSNFFFSRDTQ